MQDSYLDKSPDAGRMGKAAEYLVAAFCILATRGQLNVSTSMVDDEGVDLVFHRRGGLATLAVQVKARMSDGSVIQRGTFQAQVRSQTFAARGDLDLLFVAIDIDKGAIDTAWLIPSPDFQAIAGQPNKLGRYRYSASTKVSSKDRWSKYRLEAADLPVAIIARLAILNA